MIKGIQPVLLSRWSQQSVKDLIAVINDYGHEFEIGIAPFFNNASPWTNINSVIAGTKKKLNIVVHLCFHSKDDHSRQTIRQRARRTYEEFIASKQGQADISVCPMLEDTWSDRDFKEVLTDVAGQIPWEVNPKLAFRRTNNLGGGTPDVSFEYVYKRAGKQMKKRVEIGVHKAVRLERESHGAIGNAPHAGIYSNDGNFVWFDNPAKLINLPFYESADSFPNADPKSPQKYSLSYWKMQASSRRVLLWRPAYNLNQPVIRKGAPVTYSRQGGPGSANDTQESEKNAFNAVEREALRYFLGLQPEDAHKPKPPSKK